jgi:hypothetical protein
MTRALRMMRALEGCDRGLKMTAGSEDVTAG